MKSYRVACRFRTNGGGSGDGSTDWHTASGIRGAADVNDIATWVAADVASQLNVVPGSVRVSITSWQEYDQR